MNSLLQQLKRTWHETIPVSQFMEIEPLKYEKDEFQVSANLEPNINLHNTMFAGSIYTLATLTGWGCVWLNLKQQQQNADIVLGKADIRYLKPITQSPIAKVNWTKLTLDSLAQSKNISCRLTVNIYCNDQLCGVFEGTYFCLPKINS